MVLRMEEWIVEPGSRPGPTRRAVAEFLRARGLERVDDVEIVVGELLANALRYRSGSIRIVVEVQRSAVLVRVEDTGASNLDAGHWPPETGAAPGADAPGGRGLWIARALADRLEVMSRPDGSAVAARFDLGAGHP